MACNLVRIDDFCGTLKQTAVQVEDVARISLAARRTTKQQRHLTVRYGLFRKVVINNQCGTASVAEELADGGARKRCVELHSGRVRSRCRNYDCIGHCAVTLERFGDVGHCTAFLPDCHVDAVNGFPSVVETLLVDDGIDGDSRFSRLTVTNDKFALTAADWCHSVNRFQTCLQRLLHRLTEQNARRLALERHFVEFASYRALAVDRLANGVDDAAEKSVAHID